MSNARYCHLRLAADGLEELCTGDVCPFWEPGGAVVPGGCIIERLGTDVRRGVVATHLLELRNRLERERLAMSADERSTP